MVTAGSMPRQECTVELLNACDPTPPRSTLTCLGMSPINDRPIRVVGIAQLYSEDSPCASQVLPQQGPGSVELRQTASRWSVRWRAADTRQRHSILSSLAPSAPLTVHHWIGLRRMYRLAGWVLEWAIGEASVIPS